MPVTYPLPRWPRLLLSAGLIISSAVLILSILNGFGAGTRYSSLAAASLTLIHHVTYFILSLRKHGPPILPTPKRRQSVYPPAAPRSSGVAGTLAEALDIPIVSSTGEERTSRHLETPTPSNLSNSHPLITSETPSYPPYLTHAATPTLACLLALLWSGLFWIPFTRMLETQAALRITEGILSIVQTGLLWSFFGICLRQRQLMLRRRDFIRMVN